MKKLLLIVGIVSLIACALSFAVSAFSWVGYYQLLDGSADLYSRLHQRMIVCFVAGIVLAAAGTVCMALHFKK